jgi:hypothetical protein
VRGTKLEFRGLCKFELSSAITWAEVFKAGERGWMSESWVSPDVCR